MTQHAQLFRNSVDEHLIRASRYPLAVQQLLLEWRQIAHSPTTAAVLNGWAQASPALAGHSDLAALVDHVDQADDTETDEILGALVRLDQQGQDLAGRVVLQLMLPALTKLSHKCTLDVVTPEDRWQLLLLTFLATVRHTTAQRRFAGRLVLETLRAMTRPLRDSQDLWVRGDREKPGTVIEDLERHDDQGHDFTGQDIDETSGLDELLVWAVQESVLNIGEAQLMASSYLQDRKLEVGLSEADRRRRSRVRRKLIDAVRAHVTGLDQDLPDQVARVA